MLLGIIYLLGVLGIIASGGGGVSGTADETAPDIIASVSPAANPDGWHNTDVTVSFTCTDDDSGIKSCPTTVQVTTEGIGQIVSGTATDVAGNIASTQVTLNIDKIAPVVTVDTPTEAERVFGRLPPVRVDGIAMDSLSGLVSLTCHTAPIILAGPDYNCDVAVQDGLNTITVSATDEAGNTSTIIRQFTYLKPELELAFIDSHELIWSSYGASPLTHASFFRPIAPAGFHLLGHYGYQSLINIPNGYALAVRELNPGSGALASPSGFTIMWDTVNGGLNSTIWGSFWKPISPPGYTCMGMMVQTAFDIFTPPDTSSMKCVRDDLAIKFEGTSYEAQVLWDTGANPDHITTPFISKLIIPKKSIPSARHAIYPGTFNGSNYSSPFQDVDLMNWLDGEKVLHVSIPQQDIVPLIEQYGPLVWLHPQELYFLDHPENILDVANLFKGHILNESSYDLFQALNLESTSTSADTFYDDYKLFFLDDPLRIGDPSYKSWIEYSPLDAFGDLFGATAYVRILPVDAVFTDVQFWFYYPYNGPGRITLTIGGGVSEDIQLDEGGRHYGDWEHVTLRILNQARDMAQHQLVGVYMSRHSQGQWFSRNFFGTQLGFDGSHPIVYSGKFSHAFYPLVHSHIIYGTKYMAGDFIRVDAFDQTGLGYAFQAYADFNIIQSGVEGVRVEDKDWLGFIGRWGGYELLEEDYVVDSFTEVGAGPYGPNAKNDFKYGDPFDWYWVIKVTHE